MSDSFAPNESVARFETKSWPMLYWLLLILSGLTLAWVAAELPEVLSGENAPHPLYRIICASLLTVSFLGSIWMLDRRRVIWIRTANKGGIQ